jgi:hypothetical protein
MKSLIARTVLIASLALAGNAAMAANTPAHKLVRTHAVGAAPSLPYRQQADVGQFIQSMFGGWPMQYSARPSRRAAGSQDWSTSYDSSPSIDSSGTDAQVASDAEAQAIQSANDSSALNASVAAAEAQNDAANAATLQTEINAGF